MPQLLGNLVEKGVAKMFYLSITLEDLVKLEALDTAANSTSLFTQLQILATSMNKTLQPKECSLDVQGYSTVGTRMNRVISIHRSHVLGTPSIHLTTRFNPSAHREGPTEPVRTPPGLQLAENLGTDQRTLTFVHTRHFHP